MVGRDGNGDDLNQFDGSKGVIVDDSDNVYMKNRTKIQSWSVEQKQIYLFILKNHHLIMIEIAMLLILTIIESKSLKVDVVIE